MYPAVAFAQGLYTADDLPDEVMIAGVLAYKQEGGFPRYLSDDGDFFISDPSEDNPPEDALWGVTIFGQSQFDLSCLINSYDGSAPFGVEDQFADTYTVTVPEFFGNQSGTYTATRRNICQWSVAGFEGQLEYFPDTLRWEVNLENEFHGPINESKIDPQNSPTGDYGPSNRRITVS
jgi:hypothetical protein